MSMQQCVLEIPLWVEEGIASGKLIRYGGVIRNNAGEIKHFLKDPVKVEIKENPTIKMNTFVDKMDSRVVWFVGVSATALGISVAAHHIINKKKEKLFLYDIERLNQSLIDYLKAANNGELTTKTIEDIENSVKILKTTISNINNLSRLQSLYNPQQLNGLIDLIYKYTLDLAKKNLVEAKEIKRTDQVGIKNNINDLQSYLQLQHKISMNFK